MRYTQKYLEENYSQEEINEGIGKLIGKLIGKGKKGKGKGKKPDKPDTPSKGRSGLGGAALTGAAIAGGSVVGDVAGEAAKETMSTAANLAQKVAGLAMDPDRGRPSAAGFGGVEDRTAAGGRRIGKQIAQVATRKVVGGLSNLRKRAQERAEEAEEGAESSDLETEFKKKRGGKK